MKLSYHILLMQAEIYKIYRSFSVITWVQKKENWWNKHWTLQNWEWKNLKINWIWSLFFVFLPWIKIGKVASTDFDSIHTGKGRPWLWCKRTNGLCWEYRLSIFIATQLLHFTYVSLHTHINVYMHANVNVFYLTQKSIIWRTICAVLQKNYYSKFRQQTVILVKMIELKLGRKLVD